MGDIRQTQEEKEISNNLKNCSKYLKEVKAIYDYLSDNQNHWTIKNNTLYTFPSVHREHASYIFPN